MTGMIWRVRYLHLKFFLTFLLISFWDRSCGHANHDTECTAIGEHDHLPLPDATNAVVDRNKAMFEQNYYLQKLFDHYGENGTLTVEGLEKLLCNIGVGEVRTIKARHSHFDHVSKKHTVLAEGSIHHHCCPGCRHIRLRIGIQTTPKQTGTSPKHSHSSGVTPPSGVSAEDKSGTKKHMRAARSPPSAIPATTNTRLMDKLKAEFAMTDSYSTRMSGLPLTEYSTHKDGKEVQKRNNPLENHTDKDLKGEECLNAYILLSSHGMTPQMTLDAEQFGYICPALLDQIESKACVSHTTGEKHSASAVGAAWIGGFVSVTIISLLSLLGIIFMPLINKTFFKFLLTFLVALAVGTLSGDAFLHLLPHSQSVHHHDVEDQDHLDSVWKGLTALGGLYFMFLIEHLITLIKLYKGKKKQKKSSQDDQEIDTDRNAEPHESQELSKDENPDIKQFADPDDCLVEPKDQSNLHSLDHSQNSLTPEQEVMIAHAHPEGNYNTYVPRGCENKCHSHFHDTIGNADDSHHHHHRYHHILHHHHHQNHHPHSHSHYYFQEDLKDAGIATLAWMVIMGDGLHNFSDGLAIGAAFTGGLSSGLSTSVAVFCHELPHELGDFAVLLKAGMTVKQAILYNILSALLGYLGMITGTAIGHYAENVSSWIFAVTAGLFLYVALVDMVPEMLHSDAGDHDYSHGAYFLLQNSGMLLGFGIMLLIAVFEHKILSIVRL
ncbi:zinc transporter ZIP6 isoform X2 [Rhincodon typus]|uniref:zinc transporter ZIP6 isoform X2 n=1 Tax=Rhincodon typus TaxID=259920 RepID=UPI00202F5867|nr:zinc transporter ZIP6 isoform X2 [Rhincodon typus]